MSDFWAAKWKDVDVGVKKALFADYMAQVYYPDPEDVTIAMMREAWNRKAMSRYSSIVYDMKKRDNDKRGRPPYILEIQWKRWVEYWKLPEVISKSEKASMCRKSNPRLHTTGSISMEETAYKMSLELGKPVSMFDVFRMTHIKNKKEIAAAENPATITEQWVDSNAENFQVKYKAAYDERLTAISTEMEEDGVVLLPEQEIEIFHSLAPLNAKGRAYPIGNLLDDVGSATQRWRLTYSSSGSHSYVGTTMDQMSSKFHAMEEEVQCVNAKLEEERLRFEHERIRMEEERRHETEAFERRMTQIEQRLLLSSLPP